MVKGRTKFRCGMMILAMNSHLAAMIIWQGSTFALFADYFRGKNSNQRLMGPNFHVEFIFAGLSRDDLTVALFCPCGSVY